MSLIEYSSRLRCTKDACVLCMWVFLSDPRVFPLSLPIAFGRHSLNIDFLLTLFCLVAQSTPLISLDFSIVWTDVIIKIKLFKSESHITFRRIKMEFASCQWSKRKTKQEIPRCIDRRRSNFIVTEIGRFWFLPQFHSDYEQYGKWMNDDKRWLLVIGAFDHHINASHFNHLHFE